MAKKKTATKRRQRRELPDVTCDFSETSRAWGKEWDTLWATEQALRSSFLLIEPDEDDPRDESWVIERAQIANQLEGIPARQDELIAQVLRGVPDYYTLASVPAGTDWSDVANIEKYIAERRYQDLKDAIGAARFSAAGN